MAELNKEEILAGLAVAYSQTVLAVRDGEYPSRDMLERIEQALTLFSQNRLGKVHRLRPKYADTQKGRLRKRIELMGHDEFSRRFVEGLPKIARKVLEDHELGLWQMIQLESRDLMRMVGFGPKARKDVEEAVARLGLEFGTSTEKINSDFNVVVEKVDKTTIFDRGMEPSIKKRRPTLRSD